MRSAKVNVGDSATANQYDTLRNDAYAGSILLAYQDSTPDMKLTINAGTYYIGGTKVVYAGGQTPSFTAPSANPRIDIVVIDNAGTVTITQGSENASPVAPAYPVGKITICEVYNVTGETAIYDNDKQVGGQGYIKTDSRPGVESSGYIDTHTQIAAGTITATELNATLAVVSTGMLLAYAARTAPAGFLLCDGSPVSRTTYATLFGVIAPSLGTFTVTIATPGVFTLTAHGLVAGDAVYFTTTGALPTGLSANTIYYVISAGLTANAFEVATTRGGSAVNTTGSQSGTHTAVFCPYGLGDGSTTFNVPDLRATIPAGYKSADTNFGNMGKSVGEATHALSVGELAAHTHDVTGGDASGGGGAGGQLPGQGGNQHTAAAAATSTGSGTAHNNLQPSLTVQYIIKT